MIVTKIKQIGRTNRYHVYVDDEWSGIFMDVTLATYKIKTGGQFDEDAFRAIKEENDARVSFDMATSYMEKYVTSEKGIRDYLKKKGFDEKTVSKAVEKLKEYGFVDDEKFAKNYFESMSSGKGKRAIATKLRQKGISKEIVENLIENVDEEEQLETAKKLAEKFVKNRAQSANLRQKCLAHLVYKGYDYSVAQKATLSALQSFESETDDWF